MIPRIEFAYLVCSYLPGLPLSLLIYCCAPNILKDYPSLVKLFTIFKESAILYFITSPLIIGLFVDQTRHFFEWLIEDAWCFLPPLDKNKLKSNGIDQELFKFILSKLSIIYSLYEFFWNMTISLGIILFISYCKQWFGMMLFMGIFTSLSFMFSQLALEQQNKIIEKYFSTRRH